MTAPARIPDMVSEKEAAKMIGVSLKVIKGIRRRGEIAYVRISPRLIRYKVDDLREYLNRAVQMPGPEPEPVPDLPREIAPLTELPKRPCVYFIRSGRHGPIKIGYAKTLRSRLHALSTAHHDELLVLATLAGGDVQERRMHEKFAAYRLRGEWFEPAEELLAFIETIREPIA